MSAVIQYILYLVVLIVLAIPLGAYIKKVMNGEKTFLSKILTPCENAVYKVMHINKDEQMNWKKYAVSVLVFSGIGLIFLFLLQLLQGVLPGNPQGLSGVKWDLSFNTAASFVTNTNWQAYSGESTLSYLTQALGLTVQNFVSAATGIAVLFALIRGFIKVKADGLGSFWVDITRIVIHILIPLNLVISICLVGGGVIQNLKGAETVSLVEPIAVSADGEILENAEIDIDTNTVTVDGKKIEDAEIVTEQFVPMGPAASQVAIKQTGTNGGGYMGVNSAHPLENPNAFTNLIEMISILLIPAALCFTFGKAVKNKKQGIAIFMAMFICLVLALGTIAVSEQVATPQLAQDGVNISMTDQAGGNMEGKETRFGIATSSTWAAFTTAASNGSILGAILGIKVSFDLGGPVNKAAYTFCVGAMAEGIFMPYAAFASVKMVSGFAITLATKGFKGLYTKEEKEIGSSTWILALAGITEGAIPFMMADPIRVIIALCTGSAVTGAIVGAMNIGLDVPGAGIFSLFLLKDGSSALVNAAVWFFAAVVGALISTAILVIMRKAKLKKQKSEA